MIRNTRHSAGSGKKQTNKQTNVFLGKRQWLLLFTENVNSNRCKTELNECESKNTFPCAILRVLERTESVSTWKSSSTNTRWDISILLPRYVSSQGATAIPNHPLNSCSKMTTYLRSLMAISYRQQCQLAQWQSSLLIAPSSPWPRGGPSDQICSFSSLCFRCSLKHPWTRSDLGSFGAAFTYFSAVPLDPV